MSKIYLSQDGYDSLKNELHKLKTIDRPNIINQIAEARDKGDLSENAEYDAAKEAQGLLESRIAKLEEDLVNARVIERTTDVSKVHLLSTVVIKRQHTDVNMTYTIVSESEANLAEKKISITSPIGKSLVGKSVGDLVEVNTPNGVTIFEILDIILS
tara:strand:+ start:8279 stop:8749 length:471 start_codon:yes stop_codon:yes gene_type:complete